MSVDPGLLARALANFRETFAREPDLVAFAPGRVNLIGEHTDYNDGFSLPCALSFGTVVALGRRTDILIEARALDLAGAVGSFELDATVSPRDAGHWENHVRGVACGLPHFDLPVCGADLVIAGDVPQGAGLSSSASLGVALALGLTTLAGAVDPDRAVLARVAQWSEHHFVGCACGLMDQLTSAFGSEGEALLIDFRNLAIQPIAFPGDARIMIVHSGVTRGLVESAYNERRRQCERAAMHYGVAALRDLDLTRLVAARGELDELAFRRARHIVSDNDRTVAASRDLANGDIAAFGRAMYASHVSMRDDFEISLPAVDALVDCLARVIGPAGGARMTGGGFGGCVVAVLPHEKVDEVSAAVVRHWEQANMSPQLMVVAQPAVGACLLPF